MGDDEIKFHLELIVDLYAPHFPNHPRQFLVIPPMDFHGRQQGDTFALSWLNTNNASDMDLMHSWLVALMTIGPHFGLYPAEKLSPVTLCTIQGLTTVGWMPVCISWPNILAFPFVLFTEYQTLHMIQVFVGQWQSAFLPMLLWGLVSHVMTTCFETEVGIWNRSLHVQLNTKPCLCLKSGAGTRMGNPGHSLKCLFCSCSDSRFHRFWQCERFHHLRRHVFPEDLAHVVELPEALTLVGVYSQRRLMSGMPTWPQHAGPVDLFTDGSCHNQHSVASRSAGWSVIFASTQVVHDFSDATVLDSGVLPGLLQSAVRADFFAIMRALHLAKSHPGLVRLWSDCSSVVRRVRRLLAGHQVRFNSAHADLWQEVALMLPERVGPTEITHVSAHQPLHGATVFQEWCFRNSMLAALCSSQPKAWCSVLSPSCSPLPCSWLDDMHESFGAGGVARS